MLKILSWLFFLSGITGLIYEVLWAKYFSLFIGSTALANTIVLATFLGGLALGNALIGIWADRTENQLRLYGWLELGIGILGVTSPLFLTYFSNIYIALARDSQITPFLLIILRFSLTISVILLPTILMGGTLPCLSRFATFSFSQIENNVSWLYFLNSSGAVFGAILAGFFLIPTYGLDMSITFAATLNIIIGIISLSLGKNIKKETHFSFQRGKTQGTNISNNTYNTLQVQIIYGAVLLSGFVALSYEVAWIRLLSLTLGSSTYSFSLMIAAFIAGIALGSLLITYRILPDLNSYLLFGLAELSIALSVILVLPLYERLPYYFALFSGMVNHTPSMFYLFETFKFFFCFLFMLLPSTFLGMTLPLSCKVITKNITEVGEKVGKVYSMNTLGNVMGAAIAGLILLPLLGLKILIEAGAVVNLLIGSVIILTTREWGLSRKAFTVSACFVAFIISFSMASTWNKTILTSGGFRNRHPLKYKDYNEFKKASRDNSLLYYQDDISATVALVKNKEGDLFLKVNGKTDATSKGDLPTQLLLAHIPLHLNSAAKKVLVVGLGSGITSGSALRFPIEKMDVIEISQGVIEAAKFFKPYNYNALENPRLHLHKDDAKTFLQLTENLYDVIISEPSNPWIAGIGNLFSVEFYREASSHLAEGGVMTQWFHLYEMNDYTIKLILRTFSSVFKHVTLWNTSSMDTLLIGSNSPLLIDFNRLEKRFNHEEVKEDLKRIKIRNLSTLLSLQIASNATVKKMAGKGRLNEDHFPILEYEAPKAFFLGNTSRLVHFHDERNFPPKGNSLYLTRYLDNRKHPLSKNEFKNLIEYHRKHGLKKILKAIMSEELRNYPQDFKTLKTTSSTKKLR